MTAKESCSVVLVLWLCVFLPACSSSKSPENQPVKKEKILTTLFADYDFNPGAASGEVTYTAVDGVITSLTIPIGQEAELGEIYVGGTRGFDITVNANGALKQIFKNVPLQGTKTLKTKVLELADFNIDGFMNYFLADCQNANKIWNQQNITVIFNPDPATGLYLPNGYITETEKAVQEIQGYSEGFIKSVQFTTGNKPLDPSVPPDGEIWVFRRSDDVSIGNVSYPLNADVVKSAKVFYNINRSAPVQVRKETFDAFIQGNQNSFLDNYLAKWFAFALNHRPKGNDHKYRIYQDREEFEGFYGDIQAGQRVYVQYIPDPLGNISGNFMGEPEYRRIQIDHRGPSKNIQPEKSVEERKRVKN